MYYSVGYMDYVLRQLGAKPRLTPHHLGPDSYEMVIQLQAA